MKVFIDTSAFYALASQNDHFHSEAKCKYEKLLKQPPTGDLRHALLTTSYVIIETVALIHNRGNKALAYDFLNSIEDIIEVIWVSEVLHSLGIKLYSSNKKRVSFVDCVSFASMRQYDINTFLGFDQHFFDEGFKQA